MVKFAIVVFVLAFLAIIGTSFIVTGGPSEFFRSVYLDITGPVTGTLTINPREPEVKEIRVDSNNCTQTATACQWQGTEGQRTTIPIVVKIEDVNGDCGSNGNLHVYVTLCEGAGTCTVVGQARSAELTGTKTTYGEGSRYCDIAYTVDSDLQIEFQELPGTWAVYANVTENDGSTWGSDHEVKWDNGNIVAARYPDWDPETSEVDFEVLNAGSWNDGIQDKPTSDNRIQNSGNVLLTVRWDATDFTYSTYVIGVNSTNSCTGCIDTFYLDDNTDRVGGAFAFPDEDVDSPNYVAFPSAGLSICAVYDCTSPAGARQDTYYHLYIAAGIGTGTYTNSIGITTIG